MTHALQSPLEGLAAERSLLLPSAQDCRSAIERVLRIVSAALAAAGLFALSWERFLNVPLGAYNVKLSSLLFSVAAAPALALVLAQIVRGRRLPRMQSRSAVVIGGAALLTVVYFVVRGLLVPRPGSGIAEIAAVLTGAALPALVVGVLVRSRGDLVWALDWLLRGACVACVFGLYQLLAFYLGLPQGIEYTGVAVGGAIGRISAFSYEPAYFAYFLVLALGALITRARIRGVALERAPLLLISITLALASVRALIFIVPLLIVLLAIPLRRNWRFALRGALLAAVLAVGVTGLNTGIKSVLENRSSASAASSSHVAVPSAAVSSAAADAGRGKDGSARVDRVEGSDEASRPAASGTGPALSVFNPSEKTSNAPRLQRIRQTLAIVEDNAVLGVGPGMLGTALAGAHAGRAVVNNVWLQALVDGGVPLLLLEVVVVGGVVVAFVRLRRSVVQPLLASWLAVLAVGGMLTSYFFDIKIWVVLALVLAASRVGVDGPGPEAGSRAPQPEESVAG